MAQLKYNKDEVLVELKTFIENIGYVPKFSEIKRIHYKPGTTWFTNNFGSYENALGLIGYSTTFSKDDLIKILVDFYDKNGKSPTVKDIGNLKESPSSMMFYDKFSTSSWNKILETAGLPTNWNNYDKTFGDEYGLEKLREFYTILGRLPKSEDFRKYHWKPSTHYYLDKYKTLGRAFYSAGLIEAPMNEKERIDYSIKRLIEISIELKKCPTVKEYDENKQRGYDRRELEKHIGLKYNDICKKYITYDVNKNKDITMEEITKTVTEIKNIIGRPPMYKELKEFGCTYSHRLFNSKANSKYNDFIRSLGWIPTGTDTSKKSEEDMLDDFYNFFLELKRVPTVDEINNNGNIPSYSTYTTYFGSTENICNLLDIDCSLYYNNQCSTGRICFDKSKSICRSIPEMNISNYLIDNNIIFDKETKYKDIVPINNNRRLDWTIYSDSGIYYVEYFGMYSRNTNGKLNRKYFKKLKEKIRLLYRFGHGDNCIFIFPCDLLYKSMDDIFEKIYR